MRNQIEFLPSFYGVQSAGGVAVPLNADSRGLLLQRVIERADVRAIIARGDLLAVLEELDGLGAVELIVVTSPEGELPASVHGARVVEYRAWISGRSRSGRASCPTAPRSALIQFTSGTTGNSKGVVYPHHFLYLYSAVVTDAQGHTRDDVLTTPLPLFHVAALHIICNSALHAGCVAHLKSRFSARTYWQEIADDGATFGILLGTLAAILLRTGGEAPPHRLRALFCLPFPPGGEEFERRFSVKLLWQGYGMTEVYPHPMQREIEPGRPTTRSATRRRGSSTAPSTSTTACSPPGVPASSSTARRSPTRWRAATTTTPRRRSRRSATSCSTPATSATSTRRAACTSAAACRTGSAAAARTSPRPSWSSSRPSTKRSWSAPRTACPASSASTRSSSTSTRATRSSTCASTTLARGPAAALHGPALHRGPPGELPKTPSQKVQKLKLAEAGWTGRR